MRAVETWLTDHWWSYSPAHRLIPHCPPLSRCTELLSLSTETIYGNTVRKHKLWASQRLFDLNGKKIVHKSGHQDSQTLIDWILVWIKFISLSPWCLSWNIMLYFRDSFIDYKSPAQLIENMCQIMIQY